MKPLCIDVFCGLGGWSEGFLAEGWECIGFDIERHVYGTQQYPGQLVLQDALTIHGKQFKDADCLVMSPPCQEFSYMAMPWTRAKEKAAALRDGRDDPKRLTALFDACFRIQREANEANRCAPNSDCMDCDGTGNFYRHDEDNDYLPCDTCAGSGRRRYIPLVVENVRGAQEWVGPARWRYGSFFLWGDVPALMPMIKPRAKVGGIDFNGYGTPGYKAQAFNGTAEKRLRDGEKTSVHLNRRDGHSHTRHLTNQAESDHIKNSGGSWLAIGSPGQKETGQNPVHEFAGIKNKDADGYERTHPEAFGWKKPRTSSDSKARKAASAMIAKIPLALSRYIAACYYPKHESNTSRAGNEVQSLDASQRREESADGP